MSNYIELSTVLDENNMVDIIANKTKRNYLKFSGRNPQNAIDSVHKFMCNYGIWDEKDTVIKTTKPASFVPEPAQYHDISFAFVFYQMAHKAYNMLQHDKRTTNPEPQNVSTAIERQPVLVKQPIPVKQLINHNITNQQKIQLDKMLEESEMNDIISAAKPDNVKLEL